MIINYEYDPNIYQKLKLEKDRNIKNGFYHYIQIQFAYNSNHIEGSTLTPEQTESIFDRVEISGKAKVDEVLETANHYKMFDYLLDTISEPLTNTLIKELHLRLRNGIDEDAGNYKKFQNQIGSINPISTTNVKDVPAAIDKLLASYNCIDSVSLENIAAFHSEFDPEMVYTEDMLSEMMSVNECFANRAAACLLMPKFLVKRVLRRHTKNNRVILYDDGVLAQDQKLLIQKMADILGVSYTAFYLRLQELDLFERRPIEEYIHRKLCYGEQ